MHINLYLIPFVIVLGLLLGSNNSSRNRVWYIILCSAVLVFVASMRSPEFMTNTYHIDTLNYLWSFENSLDMGWEEFWASVVDRYSGLNDESDIGFVGFEKFIGLFTQKFHFFSLIADLVFFIPFGIILYRYCSGIKQIIFAYVFYIALIQVFMLAGARQMFALGFDMMALISIIDKKKFRMILFFVLGVSIHFSSILFAIPLLLLWFGISPRMLKVLHATCLFLFPIVLIIPNTIIMFMGNAIGMEKYAHYGEYEVSGGGTTFIALIELLSAICFIAINRKELSKDKILKSFYVMAPLFTVFAPLIISNGTMIRISLYFHMFLALLVPYSIDRLFKGRNSTYAYMIAILALSFLSLSDGGLTYYFFWQL